jgi:hypothetical protein
VTSIHSYKRRQATAWRAQDRQQPLFKRRINSSYGGHLCMPGAGFELASTCWSNAQHGIIRTSLPPSTIPRVVCILATQGTSDEVTAVRCIAADTQCDATGEYRHQLANEFSPCFGHITIISAADSMPLLCLVYYFTVFLSCPRHKFPAALQQHIH